MAAAYLLLVVSGMITWILSLRGEASVNPCGNRTPSEMECPDLVDPKIFYSGNRVSWGVKQRAVLTIPREFYLAPSKIQNAGLGVFARTFIARNTWLGEYEGEFLPLNMTERTHDYAWLIYRAGTPVYHVDAFDPRLANWLRFINCPRHVTEENVQSATCHGRMYYRVTRDVAPGAELLVFYGDVYAWRLGIDVHNYNNRNKPFSGRS